MPANNLKPVYEPSVERIAILKKLIRDENQRNKSKYNTHTTEPRQPSIHECKVGQ